MAKKNVARAKTRKESQNKARTHAKTQTQSNNEKFFAWLGKILSDGMTQEDFDKARLLFKQGISVEEMRKALALPRNMKR